MPVPTAPELIRLLTAPLDAAVRAYDALMSAAASYEQLGLGEPLSSGNHSLARLVDSVLDREVARLCEVLSAEYANGTGAHFVLARENYLPDAAAHWQRHPLARVEPLPLEDKLAAVLSYVMRLPARALVERLGDRCARLAEEGEAEHAHRLADDLRLGFQNHVKRIKIGAHGISLPLGGIAGSYDYHARGALDAFDSALARVQLHSGIAFGSAVSELRADLDAVGSSSCELSGRRYGDRASLQIAVFNAHCTAFMSARCFDAVAAYICLFGSPEKVEHLHALTTRFDAQRAGGAA